MERQNRFFQIKCEPGASCAPSQFASMVKFHLRCVCSGLACDYFKDWDEKSLYWNTEWLDWSEEREEELLHSLRFFAKRWLREQKIPESKLDDYVRFDTIRT